MRKLGWRVRGERDGNYIGDVDRGSDRDREGKVKMEEAKIGKGSGGKWGGEGGREGEG